jgi:hypothetical protein
MSVDDGLNDCVNEERHGRQIVAGENNRDQFTRVWELPRATPLMQHGNENATFFRILQE